MEMIKETAKVVRQQQIDEGIFDMELSFPKGAALAKPGQFIAMYCNDKSKLLPRPISICGINPTEGTLRVVRKCEENDKDALRWCVAKPDKRKSRKMTNKIFSAMMYEMMGWNLDCRYKILGHKITFEDETIYVFDLMETEIFLDIKGKRAKKDTESQSTTESANNIEETVSSNTDNERSAEEIKRKNRIPFYPKEWKDSFGLPVEEHRKALEINMLDGYAEFTTGK